MVVAALGVLKAGGAYVPLDPSYPPERLALHARRTRAAAVLTQRARRGRRRCSPRRGASCARRWTRRAGWADERATDLGRDALTPEHLAYVIYTSGSDRSAQGRLVHHGRRATWSHWCGLGCGIEAADAVVLQ